MQLYSPIILKFALGIICLIIQINLMGKGNLAPSSAMDQVQNYVLGELLVESSIMILLRFYNLSWF